MAYWQKSLGICGNLWWSGLEFLIHTGHCGAVTKKWKANAFLVRCQKQSLRFEMEISHLDHLESKGHPDPRGHWMTQFISKC